MMVSHSIHGLSRVCGGGDGRAVVVIHGIRQTRDAMRPFATELDKCLRPPACTFVYGYNYNDALAANGRLLADEMRRELARFKRIDLVGYSMGGLVARLAATDFSNGLLDTIVTVATPNTGALTNAELTNLGQMGLGAFTFISPLLPRAKGIVDLTRVPEIMRERADQMRNAGNAVPRVRYASVPALFYNEQRRVDELGPSAKLRLFQAVFLIANLKLRLANMQRPHDGVVTEKSSSIARIDSQVWDELRLMPTVDNGRRRMHAVTQACTDEDHCSIMKCTKVVQLVGHILDKPDWRQLEGALKAQGFPIHIQLA